MGGRPYRSKMACTPAMAFRLFSSLEGAGFSAGPGIAGGARRRRRRSLADHEGENAGRSRKQGPLCSGLLKSLVGALFCFACFFFLPTTKSPSPEALGSLTNVRPPQSQSAEATPGHGFGPGDWPRRSWDGPREGQGGGERAPGVTRGAASCPPRSSSPSRRPARPTGTAARNPTFGSWIFLFLVFGLLLLSPPGLSADHSSRTPRPSRQVYFCLSVRPGRKYDRTSHTTRGNVRRAVVLPFANVSMFEMSPDFWDIFIYTPCPCQVPVSRWQPWPGSQH